MLKTLCSLRPLLLVLPWLALSCSADSDGVPATATDASSPSADQQTTDDTSTEEGEVVGPGQDGDSEPPPDDTSTEAPPDGQGGGPCALFQPAVLVPVGLGPIALTAADTDRDGVADLVVANADDDTVTLARGNGDGTFQDAHFFPVTGTPQAVLVVDLEQDDAADLVVAGGRRSVDDNLLVWPTASNAVTTIHGSSEATFFMAQVEHPVAGLPVALATADFDADGRADLVTASGGLGRRVNVLLAQAGGGFAPAASFDETAAGVVALELTGDSHADLAVVRDDEATLAILPGRGDGTFAAPIALTLGAPSTAVATGDLDGDGRFDLVTANTDGSADLFFLGQDGGIAATQRLSVGSSLNGVVVADVDGDGRRDLTFTSPNDGSLYVVQGFGGRKFSDPKPFALEGTPMAVSAGDLNGDGLIDLAVALNTADAVAVLLGTGKCTQAGPPAPLKSPPAIPADPAAPLSELRCANFDDVPLSFGLDALPVGFDIGDLDGDGQLDLVTLDAAGDGGDAATLTVRLGTGNGTFGAAHTQAVPKDLGQLRVARITDDAKLDVVAAYIHTPQLAVFPGLGDGGLGARVDSVIISGGLGGLGPIAVADYNGDGLDDVASLSGGNEESVALSVGNGGFGEAGRFHTGDSPSLIVAGDFDGDHDVDLGVPGFDKDVSVLLNGGAGTFATAGAFATHIKPVGVASADLDGDGDAEVLVALNQGKVEVLVGGNAPVLAPPVAYTVGPNPTAVAVADFNDDGHLDVAVATLEGLITVLAGQGDATFGLTTSYGVGAYASDLRAGDFNADGQPDLLYLDADGRRLNVLLGRRRCR